MSQNQMSTPMRHENQSFGGSSGAYGDKNLRNPVGSSNKSQLGSVRRCFECNSPDHIRANCPHVQTGSNVGNTAQHKIAQSGIQAQKPIQTQTTKPVRHINVNVNVNQLFLVWLK